MQVRRGGLRGTGVGGIAENVVLVGRGRSLCNKLESVHEFVIAIADSFHFLGMGKVRAQGR